jgi:hypothetical protein
LWGDFPNRGKPGDPRDEGERRRNLDDTMTTVNQQRRRDICIEEKTAIA